MIGISQPKRIAIDIDDTINNFTEVLQNTKFPYDKNKYNYNLDETKYNKYIEIIKKDELTEELCTDITFLRVHIYVHQQCYRLAQAKPDAIEFMQWLKSNNWETYIVTSRDLRYNLDTTQEFLKNNNMPYEFIFNSDRDDKIILCGTWNIPYLIDDVASNIVLGQAVNVKVFFPIMDKHKGINKTIKDVAKQNHSSKNIIPKGFKTFDEVKQWIN